MRKRIHIFPVLLSIGIVMLCASCAEDDIFIKPVAEVMLSTDQAFVYEEITIENQGQGQKVTVFTGKEGEVYGKPGARGISVDPNKPVATTTYVKAGEYKVFIVATGFDNRGGNLEIAIDSAILTIVDTVKTINKVVYNESYSLILLADPDISFVYKPEIFPNEDQNFIIPVHDFKANGLYFLMRSAGKNVTSASRYALKPYIIGNSLSLSYTIKDVPLYNTGNTVIDHSDPDNSAQFKPVKYSAIAADGSELDYYACPVFLPYFATYSLNSGGTDYAGTFWINRLDYKVFEYHVSVPVAADSSNLVPTYALSDTENVQLTVVNDGKAESDFSGDGQVAYELTYTRPKEAGDQYKGEISYTSTIIVKAFFDKE